MQATSDNDNTAAIEQLSQMNSTELMRILDTDELRSAITSESGSVDGANQNGENQRLTQNVPRGFIPVQTMGIGQTTDPFVEVIEQPKSRALRFRYQCEGRSAGSIAGESTRPDKKSWPTIKVHNYQGPLICVVSCVTNESKPKPHPHSLVGTDCTKGVCTVKIRDKTTIPFNHLGIQCARKKDIEDFLKVRQEINVDPYQTGFDHAKQSIDLNVVRLCFQVFLPDKQGKYTRILKPICSNAIFDKKVVNDLCISRLDRVSGSAKGGDEIFMFCDKVAKDDIAIVFQETNQFEDVLWAEYGEFGAADVHKQYAIVFKTPRYRTGVTTRPVEVQMKLKRPSDGETSTPVTFVYMPDDPDPFHFIEKKRRKNQLYDPVIKETLPKSSSLTLSSDVKDRIRAKATRKLKIEGGGTSAPALNGASSTVQSTAYQTTASAAIFDASPNPNVFTNFVPTTYAQSSDAYQQATSENIAVAHGSTDQTMDYNVVPVSSWLNHLSYGGDMADLPLPTQVTDRGEVEQQFTTLDTDTVIHDFLADNIYSTSGGGFNPDAPLGDLSGDLLMTSLDPPIAAVESISSET